MNGSILDRPFRLFNGMEQVVLYTVPRMGWVGEAGSSGERLGFTGRSVT
jgi:hypothetical protein